METIVCPTCGRSLQLPAVDSNSLLACPECGARFTSSESSEKRARDLLLQRQREAAERERRQMEEEYEAARAARLDPQPDADEDEPPAAESPPSLQPFAFEGKLQQMDRWDDDRKTRVFRLGVIGGALVGFLLGLALMPSEGFGIVGVLAIMGPGAWAFFYMWWSLQWVVPEPEESEEDSDDVPA